MMRIRWRKPFVRGLAAALGRTVAHSFFSPLRDFVYPPVCFLCGASLEPCESVVCAACWTSFTIVRAGHPAWGELRDRIRAEGFIDEIMGCYLFERDGALQEAVHLLKYRKIRSLGLRLGAELGFRIMADPRFASADLLVPVPLHPAKQRERGYNQSGLLCEGASRVTGIAADHSLLRRTKYTKSQTLLDLSVRRKNVGDAFAIRPGRAGECAGKRCILIDDVMTTGATMNACARLLRERGAASVLAAAVALAA